MLRNSLIAGIRTATAVAVAWCIAKLTGLGVALDPETGTILAGAAFAVAVGGYNVVVNYLTERVHPVFGYLLGINKPPAYDVEYAEDTAEDAELADIVDPGAVVAYIEKYGIPVRSGVVLPAPSRTTE